MDLFCILRSRFRDADVLDGNVFDMLKEFWDRADDLERSFLCNWMQRAWKAKNAATIVANIHYMKGKLLAAVC